MDQLIKTLRDDAARGAVPLPEDELARLLTQLQHGEAAQFWHAKQRERLFSVLTVQLAMLRPNWRERLQSLAIYLLPVNACLALTQCDEQGEPFIVISQGMIDLLAVSIYDTYLQAEVPALFDDLHFDTVPDLSIGELFPNLLLIKRSRFLRFGEPLFDSAAPLSDAARAMCRDSVQGALMFLLLHELGHIERGHLSSQDARYLPFYGAVDETFSHHQRQEIEADDFAMNALVDEAMLLATYWVPQALTLFSSVELVTGQRGNRHPLSLNRAANANARRAALGINDGSVERDRLLAKKFLETEREVLIRGNKLINTPRDVCDNLISASLQLFQKSGVDLTAMLQASFPSWLDSPRSDPDLSLLEG